jgi:prophage regulatory protein
MDDRITLDELLGLIARRVKPDTEGDAGTFRLSAITGARPKAVRVLGIEGVEDYISLSSTSIYELIAQDDFPKAIPLTSRRVGWLIEELDGWIDKRGRQRANSKTILPGQLK